MHDNWDDSNYTAQTVKPTPRFSERPTIKAPILNVISSIPPRKNWDAITIIIFILLLIVAVIIYIYVNHPIKNEIKPIISYSAEPVIVTKSLPSI